MNYRQIAIKISLTCNIKILPQSTISMIRRIIKLSPACPAVAAHITCNADLGITEIAYHPLWLERSQSQAAIQQM